MQKLFLLCLAFFIWSCESSTTDQASEPDTTAETANTTEKNTTDIPVIKIGELTDMIEKQDDAVYVYNFWATWCKPCVKELPAFEKLNSEYGDKVKVVLVSIDEPGKIESDVKPFIQQHNLKSKVIVLDERDPNTWLSKISEDWQGSIPATLFIYHPKDFREFREEAFEYEGLEKIVKPLVEQ